MKTITLFTIFLFLSVNYTVDYTWAKPNPRPLAATSAAFEKEKHNIGATHTGIHANRSKLASIAHNSKSLQFYSVAGKKSSYEVEKQHNTENKRRKKRDKKDGYKAKWSAMSILSFVFGILGGLAFLLLLVSPLATWITLMAVSIIGIILGIFGLKRRKERIKRGKGFAIAGIVLSGLAFAGSIVVLIVTACSSNYDSSGSCSSGCGSCC